MAIAPVGMFTGTAAAATGTITEFRPNSIVQTTSSDPVGITSANGKIWYTDAGEDLTASGGAPAPTHQVGSFDGTNLNTYPIGETGAVTVGIAPDAAGNVWFVNNGNSADDVGEMSPGGVLAFQPLVGLKDPSSTETAYANPTGITAGPGNKMWIAEFGSGRVATVSTVGNPTLNQYPLAGGQAVGPGIGSTATVTEQPNGIAAGPNNTVWVTVQGNNGGVPEIVKIDGATPTNQTVFTPTATPFLAGITAGPDGNMWFTAEGNRASNPQQADRPVMAGDGLLGMITPSGTITTFTPPGDTKTNPGGFAPNAITTGPDGNLYMTDVLGNAIWQFNPNTSAFTKFPVPTPQAFSGNVQPTGITVGPDNQVWFTENNANIAGQTQQPAALSRVEVDSAVTFVPAPLSFGTQALNAASSKTVSVGNSLGTAITVNNTAITGDTTDFTLGTNNCSSSIPTTGCTVSVQFKPTTAGTKTATLVLDDVQGSTSRTDSVVLTGAGAGAPVFAPSSFTFTDQTLGGVGQGRVFSLSNNTGAPLPVNASGITLGGANPSDFHILSDGCSGTSIVDSSSCAVTVAFAPTGLGTRTATLSIAYSGANSPQTATLSGRGVAPVPGSNPGGGYWLVASDGGIFTYGSATFHGSAGAIHLNKPIVGMARTPDGGGYWLVATDGGIFNYGDAGFYGSAGSIHLNKPIVAMAATADGKGYWLVASDGGIFNYGDATFHGSAGSIHLNQPIVGMAATPDGGGYWLVATDGGIFNYGDATFHGSAGAIHLNQPIAGMAPTATGGGYWLVATDGGIFTYGDAKFVGSAGAIHLNKPIVGMAPALDGGGYWLVATDGGIFNYGDAGFHGSAGSIHLNQPIVGMTPAS